MKNWGFWIILSIVLVGTLVYTYNRTPNFSNNKDVVRYLEDNLKKNEKPFEEIGAFLDTFNSPYDDIRIYKPVGYDRVDYEYLRYSKDVNSKYYTYVESAYDFPPSLGGIMEKLEIRHIAHNRDSNFYILNFNYELSKEFKIYLLYLKATPPDIPDVERKISNFAENSHKDWLYIINAKWAVLAKANTE